MGRGIDEKEFNVKKEVLTLVLGALIYVGALTLKLPLPEEFSLFLLSYFIIGGNVVQKAVKHIFRKRIFDENFLMTVATAGAFAIREFPEAVAVMLFFKVGELLQNSALNKSRRAVKSLIEIKADYANLKMDGKTKKVDPKNVKVGDVIIVKPGEKVPLDGVVLSGYSMVDTSALTGEPVPKKVEPGDKILSGMINKTGLLIVQVTKKFSESTVAKIMELVENAAARKAPTEQFITKFAKYYTPAVVLGAFLLVFVPVVLSTIPIFKPLFNYEEDLSKWIYRSLTFLVISCPCALVISIPLGFFGGIGASSKRGVLIKGSNFLEGLNHLHTVVWDKTGTLTKGVFKVVKVVPKNNFLKEEVLKLAAQLESQSNHPIAQSILEAFNGEIDETTIESYEEIPGYGVKAKVNHQLALVGNDKLLHKEKIHHDTCKVEGTVVHVALNNTYMGYIVISDEIKEDAEETVKKLKKLGVKRQVMVTGDDSQAASKVAQELGLDTYFAELLPHQKVEKLEQLMKEKQGKGLIAFVGDGVNDAPALVRSDVGVAMGALGSDAAIEAADIVLLTDEPSRIIETIKIAKKTRKTVWQNISFALIVKTTFLVLGALGTATMWEAVFADVGVALLTIINSTRIILK